MSSHHGVHAIYGIHPTIMDPAIVRADAACKAHEKAKTAGPMIRVDGGGERTMFCMAQGIMARLAAREPAGALGMPG